jgi:hypothetical protein
VNRLSAYFADLVESMGNAWNRFWFTPTNPLPCSILRMGVGLLVVVHLVLLTFDLDRWYLTTGVLPRESVATLAQATRPGETYHLSYFSHLGTTEARVVHGAAILAAAAFAAGLLTRLTGVLTLAALLSYFHRLPLLAGHAEPVLIFLVAYLCIGPAGAYFSLDRKLVKLRTKADAPPPMSPEPTYWATISLRLIQLHLAAFVAMMALAKLNGDAWWDGEAIWHLLARPQSRPLDLTALRSYELVVNFWTHAVVYFELAFPILIWNRLARPILLVLGAIIWLTLALATGQWLLGLALVAASLAFVPGDAYRGQR